MNWTIFALFLVVGLGMMGAGLYYMSRETEDRDAAKRYRTMAVIGLGITLITVAWKFLLG